MKAWHFIKATDSELGAAWDAARGAARDAQNKRLTAMVVRRMKK